MTTNLATADTDAPATAATKSTSSDASRLWDRLDPVDHYLLQAVCTMWKILSADGTSARGRLTACPRAYEDLVAAGVVLVVKIDDRTVRYTDQQVDTHRVMATAMGIRLVREAHKGKWLHTAEWRNGGTA